jgi:hypothetical protein
MSLSDDDHLCFLLRETITVGELIEALERFDRKAKVLATWEGIFKSLLKESIYTGNSDLVLIDADDNFYKKRFENLL